MGIDKFPYFLLFPPFSSWVKKAAKRLRRLELFFRRLELFFLAIQDVVVKKGNPYELNHGIGIFTYMKTLKNQPKVGRYMGKTPKWMVKIMENPIKIDDLGVPLFLETSTYKYTIPESYG